MNINRNVDIICSVNNPTYLNDERHSSIGLKNNSRVSGSCITFDSKISAILAGMGEMLERERFMPNRLNKIFHEDDLITGYSFIDKNLVKTNIGNIIATGKNFIDSCGFASHTNSRDCIFNAIKEFIERQSFIFNYLSKGNAKLINLNGYGKFKYIFKKFKNLRLYDISLIEDFHVILGKVIYNENFYIGLGASNILDEAIYQCVKEIFQMNHSYSYRESNISKNIKKRSEDIDYIDMFMSLSCDRLSNAYKYLDKDFTVYKYEEIVSKEFSIENIFTQLYRQYNMKPLIFFLHPLRNIDNLKFVKVLDLNWFPNLFPKSYQEEVYDFVESVTHKKLDRRCEFIPFP